MTGDSSPFTLWRALPIQERLWGRSEFNEDGCLVWQGALLDDGYGHIRWHGKKRGVHRVAYELAVGLIPEGLELDHLCRNRACINPYHLEPVTRLEHAQRREYAARFQTQCKRGHPLFGSNLYLHSGRRHCRACRTIADRRHAQHRYRQRKQES